MTNSQICNLILNHQNLGNMGQISFELNMWYDDDIFFKAIIFILKALQSNLFCENYEPTKLQYS